MKKSWLNSCRYKSSIGSHRSPRVRMIARHVSALRISRTSCVLAIVRHLPPFAMWPAFPAWDSYGAPVAGGPAPRSRSHFPGHELTQREVGAPFGSLRSLIGFRPSTESSGGDKEDRRKPMAPPNVVAEAVRVA